VCQSTGPACLMLLHHFLFFGGLFYDASSVTGL
jgi:hypothetical protein